MDSTVVFKMKTLIALLILLNISVFAECNNSFIVANQNTSIKDRPTLNSKTRGVIPQGTEFCAPKIVDGFAKYPQGGYISINDIKPKKIDTNTTSSTAALFEEIQTQNPVALDSHSNTIKDNFIPIANQPKKLTETPNGISPEKESLKTDVNYIKENKRDALVANLTKTSPMPLVTQPTYASVLIMPFKTEGGVYTDYIFQWVKIKDSEFVLGAREGKNTSQKTISINDESN